MCVHYIFARIVLVNEVKEITTHSDYYQQKKRVNDFKVLLYRAHTSFLIISIIEPINITQFTFFLYFYKNFFFSSFLHKIILIKLCLLQMRANSVSSVHIIPSHCILINLKRISINIKKSK